MNREISYICLGAAVALTALSGCTINTYPAQPPPKARAAQPARPAAPARGQTTGPKLIQREVTVVAPGTSKPNLTDRAPRITGTILFGNGAGGLFRGEAFVIPNDSKSLPDLGSLVPFATLFTDRFNIASQDFSGGFPGALRQDEWFAIRYEGILTLDSAGLIDLELTSDDGAVLSLDGKKVIDNDGLHVATTKKATLDLTAGVHRLRLDYFQGNKGPVALQLFATDRGGRILNNTLVAK